MVKNWASWFEIPVSDFDRAKTFYEVIFDMDIHAMDLGELKMGVFPSEGGGGAICKGAHYQPGENGPVPQSLRTAESGRVGHRGRR